MDVLLQLLLGSGPSLSPHLPTSRHPARRRLSTCSQRQRAYQLQRSCCWLRLLPHPTLQTAVCRYKALDTKLPAHPTVARGRMERNDSSIKEILDQISRDDAKAVVEEVRGILLRDLKTKGQSPSVVDQPVYQPSSSTTVKPAHSANLAITSATKMTESPPITKDTDDASSDNELAFRVEKDSDAYKQIYSMVEWYRDSYLVGTEYADRRTQEKKSNDSMGYDAIKFAEISNKIFNNNISYKSLFGKEIHPKPSEFTGMGYPFLTDYAEWYIKSTYARDLLKPTAMWIASKDGPMMHSAIQSMASTIPMMQETADSAMKSNALWILQDQEWKDWAKSLTTQYVYRSQKDD